jgi:hypothetical protein
MNKPNLDLLDDSSEEIIQDNYEDLDLDLPTQGGRLMKDIRVDNRGFFEDLEDKVDSALEADEVDDDLLDVLMIKDGVVING